ncbi:hypothetical protein XH89_20070 [Bradyrhizobium sp. CCBAU 53340]|uniref:hypothetical protein n=1 Tax=Bradyrhizobium sp. CCBAU 53340 TaxID=1325112 RepID=UPI00188D0245|nr:hypothetical protein [Bradyrhizobium sp. CCBAU 53340]QOZ45524.1 hypothetical protein XH89_20070 [Bradyrhizobium sp. CCBAU 53340]
MKQQPPKHDLDQARLDFEREKWRAEESLRRDELSLKREELDRSRWINPLVIAVLAAAAAAFGNAGVTLISSDRQSQLERERSASAQKLNADQAREALRLEQTKSEAARILEVVKTNDPDKAATNLRFLIDTGLIADENTRKQIQTYLAQREPGKGVALPSAANLPAALPVATNLVACSILAPNTRDQVVRAVAAAFAAEPLGLELKRDNPLFEFGNVAHKSRIFPGSLESSTASVAIVPMKDHENAHGVIASIHAVIAKDGSSFRGLSDQENLFYRTELAKHLNSHLATSLGQDLICTAVIT